MKTDGQLYQPHGSTPPPMSEPRHTDFDIAKKGDTLLILGLLFLLLTDKTKPDLPLVAALIYILL